MVRFMCDFNKINVGPLKPYIKSGLTGVFIAHTIVLVTRLMNLSRSSFFSLHNVSVSVKAISIH